MGWLLNALMSSVLSTFYILYAEVSESDRYLVRERYKSFSPRMATRLFD